MPGLPVYAAADTHAKAERAIRMVLAAYLDAHPDSRPEARVRVARFSTLRSGIAPYSNGWDLGPALKSLAP